jgi:hypothetical protein
MAYSSISINPVHGIRFLAMAVLFLAAAAGTARIANAADEERIFLKFHVHSLGMRVGTFKVSMDLSPSGYRMGADFDTKGLLDLFAGASFEARAEGSHSAAGAVPQRFTLETDESGKGERNHVVTWNGSTPPTSELDYNVSDYRQQDVADKITADVIDPLTSLLSAGLLQSDSLCTGSYRAYDGKEMYDLAYRFVKRDDFDGDDPGVFRGEAYKCEMVYRPVAGQSRKTLAEIAESGNGGEQVYTVWMAPVQSQALGRTIYALVGAVGSSDGHDFYLYLDHATIAERPLNSQSVASQ